MKLSIFFKKRIFYAPLGDEEYFKRFGIEKEGGIYVIKNEKVLEKAYSKAWENRNYEIDKFWTRAAYFWGFIVLIFGGYISILTSEHNKKVLEMRFDLYLVLLGFLFSLSWYLVIRGSKGWQQNWEGHIDKLENFISGPIYKTIYYTGDRFYSVSKLNEVMAFAVFLVWSIILGQYINNHFDFTLNLKEVNYKATAALIVTFIFALFLRFGYCLGNYKSKKYKFFDRME